MPADLTFFWNDRMHISQTRTVTASSTASGYAVDNVREADLVKAHKPADSVSTDEWLKVDGGNTLWLGTTGATCFFAVAYDARGVNQNVFRLQTDSLDDGTFGGTQTDVVTHTLDKTAVGLFYASFTSPQKRWYRLLQKGTDRSGGNVTAKVYYWAMYAAADVTIMSTGFPGDGEGSYSFEDDYRVGVSRTLGGVTLVTRRAAPGQRFTVGFNPASITLWKKLRDQLEGTVGGPERAIFIQKEGLRNAALVNFGLCRIERNWSASVQYVDTYETGPLSFTTEPWL